MGSLCLYLPGSTSSNCSVCLAELLLVPVILLASSVNSLRLCVGVTVSGLPGSVLGGVDTLSGADIRELGLLRLISLGLAPGMLLGLRSSGVLVSSPRARLLF